MAQMSFVDEHGATSLWVNDVVREDKESAVVTDASCDVSHPVSIDYLR